MEMNYQPQGYTKPSRPPIPHGMWFILSVISCGLLFPFWMVHILIDMCMPRRQAVHYAPVPTQPHYPYPYYPHPGNYPASQQWGVQQYHVTDGQEQKKEGTDGG